MIIYNHIHIENSFTEDDLVLEEGYDPPSIYDLGSAYEVFIPFRDEAIIYYVDKDLKKLTDISTTVVYSVKSYFKMVNQKSR